MATITLKDFQPWNKWTEHYQYGNGYDSYDRTVHLDESTTRTYWYQSTGTIRVKSLALLVWTVAAHVIRIATRVFSFLTLYHFHYHEGAPDQSGYTTYVHYSLKERAIEAGKDILKTLATPFVVLFLESAALYGILNPFDGRKLYATWERFSYQALGIEGIDLFCRPSPGFCAPCFQPDATRHALGGDALNGNAW